MGLVERRALQSFQERLYPALLKKVHQAAGFNVAVEVKWDTLALDGESDRYDKCWPDVYFEPLISALARIAHDDLGRAALKAAVSKVVIQNDSGNKRHDNWASLKDGVLTLDHQPHVNVDDRQRRAQKLGDLLESKL
jgi:hypothetical protein